MSVTVHLQIHILSKSRWKFSTGREGREGVGSTETLELADVADEGRGRGVLDPHSARNENDTLTG